MGTLSSNGRAAQPHKQRVHQVKGKEYTSRKANSTPGERQRVHQGKGKEYTSRKAKSTPAERQTVHQGKGKEYTRKKAAWMEHACSSGKGHLWQP